MFSDYLTELGHASLLYFSGSGFGLAFFLGVMAITLLYKSVPHERRDYLDPLPFGLKLFWPFIQIFAYHFGANLPIDYLVKVESRLQKTGVAYLLTAEQFIGLQLTAGLLFPVFLGLVLMLANLFVWHWVLAAMLLGILLPEIWLHDTRKRRERNVIKALPVYLDFLSMAVESGLNFTGALSQAMKKGPLGALRNEFGIVIRDLRAGLSRADALVRMAERLEVQDVTTFVRAVIQAERMGSSIKKVLQIQAEQRRSERFQRAEKLAMEAPIKLIFPLIVFIFPVTFIILGFPIVMKFLNQGLL